jgi:hypothetical protein
MFSHNFIFVSLKMRKQAKKHFFRIEAKKIISLPFRVESKIMAVFLFRFASFRFEAKMMAIFCFFFVLFSLCSIFVSLQISTFCIDRKQAKKALFSHQSEKNFAPFRFEAKMTAHPSSIYGSVSMNWCTQLDQKFTLSTG